MNKLIDCDSASYYADTLCDVPTLNQSIAKILLTQSPLHAWRVHPRLGNIARESTDAMDKGTLVHAILSGRADEPQNVVVLEFDNYLTKVAKEAKKTVEDAGKIPMKRREYDDCVNAAKTMLAAAQGSLKRFGITLAGRKEATFIWTEHADDGTPVVCRCRLDHHDADAPGDSFVIDDFKTLTNGHPDACLKAIINNGGDIQGAAYTSAIRAVFGAPASFRNLFIEINPPHIITPVVFGASLITLGLSKWRRAINLWAKCLREDYWPEYVEEPVTLEAPMWALTKETILFSES